MCKRCTLKGLHCEGYPPRFQFLEYGSGASPRTVSALDGQTELSFQQVSSQNRKENAPDSNIQDRLSTVTLGDLPDHQREQPSQAQLITPEQSLSPESETAFERSSLVDEVLGTSHAQRLLVHCTS